MFSHKTRIVLIALLTLAFCVPVALAQHELQHKGSCRTHECWHKVSLKRHREFPKNHPERYGWSYKRRHLEPPVKGMLYQLRMCESTNNYRAVNGQYTGAYQYAASTWARAGGHGLAMNATPAEQDVRTAWFYPDHSSEWTCSARIARTAIVASDSSGLTTPDT